MQIRRSVVLAVVVVSCGLAAVLVGWRPFRNDPGDPRLNAFVHASPPVAIVFTSRSQPASLEPAAPEADEQSTWSYPGQGLWQAREGRLRLLTARGTVQELTWGRLLPDGDTLIDVMSPSVSLDGKTIIFAGRKQNDHGRFRLFEIGVDGSGLRQLTGGPDDPGCSTLPPLRHPRPNDATLLPAEQRRAVDYDDVDPIYLNYRRGRIAFVSSRTPDLGRGHARRCTTVWTMNSDGSDKKPLTANRNNDRWPFLATSSWIFFSLWSRNREVITADERDIRPFEPGMACATEPTDSWLGAFVQSAGANFGVLVKPDAPVWRPRALFNGRIVFMTRFRDARSATNDCLSVVQAEPGLLARVPSARPAGSVLPRQRDAHLWHAPSHDTEGRRLSLATPSPCPPNHVVLAGAPQSETDAGLDARRYGIYSVRDSWPGSAEEAELRLLFDDPELVDAEPVAVYPRPIPDADEVGEGVSPTVPGEGMHLADGRAYRGPAGLVFNSALYSRPVSDVPGQETDLGQKPIFDQMPENTLDHVRIYASYRDRFDDPDKPRIVGGWELLVKLPVTEVSFGGWVPAGMPTVLAGFTREQRVARWQTAPRDSQGRRADFYAFAGDHYSAVRAGGKHFCVGCHPGHSGLPRSDHHHAERLP